MKMFDALVQETTESIPGFALKEKRTWWWKAIYYVSGMFLWNRKFMDKMWTTIGRTVYAPHVELLGDIDDYVTLRHEIRHILDNLDLSVKLAHNLRLPGSRSYPGACYVCRSRLPWSWTALGGLVWGVGYAWPQVFALGVLEAFWTPWAWLCLLFLCPWPAPFRVWIELRGYLETIKAWAEITKEWPTENSDWLNRLVEQTFCGWSYWRMSWSRRQVLVWFMVHIREAQQDEKSKA